MAKQVQVERRKTPRLTPKDARVWCVSGEFEEMYTTVNFAKRMLNLGLRGVCVETSGRLRVDLKMSVEVRFDDLNGTLRSQARIVWVQTLNEGGNETHLAGLVFQGKLEITKPVRDYMEGARPAAIIARRTEEYRDLKRKKETTSAGPRKPLSVPKKVGALLVLLLLVYVASYGVWILRGSLDSPGGGLTYRYLSANPDSHGTEESLRRFYAPLYWAFRKAGLKLVYSPP